MNKPPPKPPEEWEQLRLFDPDTYEIPKEKPEGKEIDTEPCIWCGREVHHSLIQIHEEQCGP